MAVDKNFVVRNGLEVATDLLFTDISTGNVGVGTTFPSTKLDVHGGIGATNISVSGFVTVTNDIQIGTSGSVFYVSNSNNNVGVGTSVPIYTLDIVTPVSTGQTGLYVKGDVLVTGALSVDAITVSTATTISSLSVDDGLNVTGTGATSTTLNVTGVSTHTGFSTFADYVFIQDGLNVTGTGATSTTLNVTGVSTHTGFSTFADYVFIQDGLNVSGVGTFTTLTVTDSVSGNTTFSDDLDVDGTTDLDVLNVAETATFSSNIDANGDLDVDGHTELDNLNVSGFSTFSNNIDANGDLDVDGHTELDDLNVTGVATFTSNIDANSGLDITGVSTFKDNVHLLDDDKLQLGGSVGSVDGLEIFHDGSNSYIDDTGTGDLYIRGDNNLYITNNGGTETKARFVTDGAVELYYDNSNKLETTGFGVTVTGIVSATAYYGDGSNMTNLPGAVGGSNNQVQFNNSGVFGGDADFIFNGTDVTIGTATTLNVAGLHAPSGIVTANSFSGDGSNLTGITHSQVSGVMADLVDDTSPQLGGELDLNGNNVTGTSNIILTGSGRIGVGTNAPDTPLDVRTGGTVPAQFVTETGSSNGAIIRLRKNETNLGNYDKIGAIQFAGDDGTDSYISEISKIESVVTDATFGSEDGNLLFYTSTNGSSTEKVRIDELGRVGIGTTDPDYALDIQSGNLRLKRSGSNDSAIYFGNSTDNYIFGSRVNNLLTFGTDGSEQARITGIGSLGVGSDDPDTRVHIEESSPTDGILLKLNNDVNSSGSEAGLRIRHNNSSQLECNVLTERMGANAGLDYKIELSNSSGTVTERLRITESGNIGIGTQEPAAKLVVQGENTTSSIAAHIKSGNGASVVGLIVDGDNETGDVLIRARSNATSLPTDSDTKLILTGAGNLGLAINDPGAKLDVYGTTRLGGTASANRRADFDTNGKLTLAYGDNSNTSNLTLANLATDSTTNHGSNIAWNFANNASASPIPAAAIDVLKSQQWTSTSTTQDAKFKIRLAQDGSLVDMFEIDGSTDNTTFNSSLVTINAGSNTNYLEIRNGSDTDNYMRLYCESNTTRIADTFAGNTDKKYIHFSNPNSSNDPGFIMHETGNISESNEGVLHLVPSDDNQRGDYVSIHGSNDPDVLKLHTDGLIETAANYGLQFTSATGITTSNSDFKLGDDVLSRFGDGSDITMFYNGSDFYMDFEVADDNFYIRNSSDSVIFTFAESTGNFSAAGDVLPITDDSGNVGTSSKTWSNGRFTNLTIDSTLNVRGAIDLADSDILRFGTGDDITMFYNGSDFYIDMQAASDNIFIRNSSDSVVWRCSSAGEVRYAGDIVPDTDDTGNVGTESLTWSNGRFTDLTIDSTLSVRAAIDLADSDVLRFGSSDDAKFFYDGSNNDFELELESACGDFLITDNGTTRFTFTKSSGNFTATGDVTAFSDINLKKNIEVIPNALDKVSQIRGVTFDRIDNNIQRQSGVIAQEVEKVLPEVIRTNEDGIKSVAYGNLVGLLIESIKELKAEVETLKKEHN